MAAEAEAEEAQIQVAAARARVLVANASVALCALDAMRRASVSLQAKLRRLISRAPPPVAEHAHASRESARGPSASSLAIFSIRLKTCSAHWAVLVPECALVNRVSDHAT